MKPCRFVPKGTNPFVNSFYLINQNDRFHKGKEVFWKRLWSLNIHERIERSMCVTLPPTLSLLSYTNGGIYPLCNFGPDDSAYLFRDCTFTRITWRRSIWNVTKSCFSKHNNVSLSFIDLICSPPDPSLDKKSQLSLSLHGATLMFNP